MMISYQLLKDTHFVCVVLRRNLKECMDYFVKQTIITHPNVLMYSLKKRIVPRYTIWKRGT